MRVYLPSTLPALADVLKEGAVGPAPVHGFAVTPALREAYASGDEEELEYVAMLAAARESLRLLRANPDAPRRRVVLAADAEATWTAYDDEPAAVVVSDPVPLAALASAHIDDAAAAGDVAVAADAIAAADAGDEDAEFAVDGAEGYELAWYATQELTNLLPERSLPQITPTKTVLPEDPGTRARFSMDAVTRVPAPANEPVRHYQPGSADRAVVEAKIKELASQRAELTMTIGGRQVMGSGDRLEVVQPHAFRQVLGELGHATDEDVSAAIDAALAAAPAWRSLSFDDRAAVFLRAAELLAGPWRPVLNAASILGQSKSVFQAEIDAACELIDFWRYNVAYARQLLSEQPQSAPGTWNNLEYRPLEGFVLAITPFNFTSIAGNLPTAPALLGNVVVWKPSPTQQFAAHFTMRLLEAAGLPPGVINLVTGDGSAVSRVALSHPSLAGIHFTGSTQTFQHLWRTVGANIASYRDYPRLVGETGGKDFIIAHPSADPASCVTALVRGAFEYQGQKCSAASRAYIPRSLWESSVRDELVATAGGLSFGNVGEDLSLFGGAVIDARAVAKHAAAFERARSRPAVSFLSGGTISDSEGYFVAPTVLECSDPADEVFTTEYFGPILAVHVYPDASFEDVVAQAADVAPYALTGAIMATDRSAIAHAAERLRYSAGNFYVNDKPTGAVVGQQPFGGARGSGTNDKAGSVFNLIRWVSPRAIKETFVPATDHRYPHMG
jgi:1-pyrroline-5-carboxylate dehydrogenase